MLIFLILVCIPSIASATFSISPVKLRIHKEDKITTLTLKNDYQEPRNFQLMAYKIELEHGNEVDNPPTKDLIVSPLRFTIAPGKTQLVRVVP